jgi:hypothetical protein
MTRQHRKGKKSPSGTWIERDLFTSRAYLELSGFAPQLLVLFLAKRDISADKTVKNRDAITMTYIELENFYCRRHEAQGQQTTQVDLPRGISWPRIIRAIDNLLEHGFIRIIRRGGAFQQDKSVYGLSEDWRLWRPGIVFKKREPDTRQGRGYNGRAKKSKLAHENVPIHTHENVAMQG